MKGTPSAILAILGFFLVALPSCTPTAGNTQAPDSATGTVPSENQKLPALSWHFDQEEDIDGTATADVYLVVGKNLYPAVDNAFAMYRELEAGEGTKWNVPANSLAACTSWWAGAGDVVYVVEENGKLAIYRSLLDEQAEPTPFKRIKEIVY